MNYSQSFPSEHQEYRDSAIIFNHWIRGTPYFNHSPALQPASLSENCFHYTLKCPGLVHVHLRLLNVQSGQSCPPSRLCQVHLFSFSKYLRSDQFFDYGIQLPFALKCTCAPTLLSCSSLPVRLKRLWAAFFLCQTYGSTKRCSSTFG